MRVAMTKRVLGAALVFAGWTSIAANVAVAGAITPVAQEFQVNTITAGHQYHSRLSMNPAGTYVVTWTSAGVDGSGLGIAGKYFGSNGQALGGQFVVNAYTPSDQQYSSVSINQVGRFVVVWRGGDGGQSGVFARRFDYDTSPLNTGGLVNTHTIGSQDFPDLVKGPGGGFFVVWQSSGQDGDSSGIFSQRHNGNPGVADGIEFQVNAVTSGSQSSPRIAIAAPSNVVVVWSGDLNVFGRRLGHPLVVGAEFRINQQTNSGGGAPAVAATGDGGFIVVWESVLDGDGEGVFARRFDATGVPLATEFQVNGYTIGDQRAPEVASNGNDFIVVWHSDQDGSSSGVFGRRLDSAGPLGREFQVNIHTIGEQRDASIGIATNSSFVVVWDSAGQDGDATGVFGRRFTVLLATLDVDGDGATEPLSDGLLVLRHLLGFTGAALTSAAVDLDNCRRCEATEITAYLAGLGLQLDIDDDLELVPLTDALLVVRFLFEFSGATLTTGAVDGDCNTRCNAAAIEPYLEMLATP
jgi:hypothetical protein